METSNLFVLLTINYTLDLHINLSSGTCYVIKHVLYAQN